nr:HNH endonuclease [Halobacillus sp. Marseille-Q1614]
MIQAKSECLYCRSELQPHEVTVDHVRSFRNGGTNTYDNLLPCCRRCNSRKGDKPLLSFLRQHAASDLQLRRVVFELAQRQGRGYYDVWRSLQDDVEAVMNDEQASIQR